MKEFTTFEALLKPLTRNLVQETARRYEADYYSKTFKTWEHLVALIYAQLHDIKSLRDLEIAFKGQKEVKELLKRTKISRSTLSDANSRRPAKCFLWIAENLMRLLPRKKRKEVNKLVRKLDSSSIQLKGRGYDEWTFSNRTLRCQGLKLHVEYDGEMGVPRGFKFSEANVNDCSMGQTWSICANTIYVFDKGYYDFNWWWALEQKGAYFVTRLKKNVSIRKIEELKIKDEKIIDDSMIELSNKSPRGGKKNDYIKPLRRIVVKREGKERPLVIVSNLMEVPAEIIAELYKERWGIELFFKWMKQNLRIKKFLGKSENAVKIQIAVALIVQVLIGIFKLAFKSKFSLHQLLIWIKHNGAVKKRIYRIDKPPQFAFERVGGQE